jgi:hypothetical protein
VLRMSGRIYKLQSRTVGSETVRTQVSLLIAKELDTTQDIVFLSVDEMPSLRKKEEVVERRIKVVKGPVRIWFRLLARGGVHRGPSPCRDAGAALAVYPQDIVPGRCVTAGQRLEKFELLVTPSICDLALGVY